MTVTSMMVSGSSLIVQNGAFVQNGAPYVIASDRRIKRDIAPVTEALNKLSLLKGVYFNWREDAPNELLFDKKRHVGLIAQNVLQVVPEAVDQIGTGQYLGVDYMSLVSLLISGLNELGRNLDRRNLAKDYSQQLNSRIAVLQDLQHKFKLLEMEQQNLVHETEVLKVTHEELLRNSSFLLQKLNL